MLASGCGQAGGPAAGDAIFAGLNPQVTAEVLDNPRHGRDISQLPESNRTRAWQYTVAEMDACRDLYSAYTQWLSTGAQPDLPRWDVPTTPEPGYQELAGAAEQTMRDAYESGDPGSVVTYLTAPMSCGTWTPATPGDVNGPTIAKAVGG